MASVNDELSPNDISLVHFHYWEAHRILNVALKIKGENRRFAVVVDYGDEGKTIINIYEDISIGENLVDVTDPFLWNHIKSLYELYSIV